MSRLHSVQRVVGGFLAFVFAVSTMLPAVAQEVPPSPGNSAEWPARLWGQPQLTYDTGYTAFMQDIAKLRTTARLMATAAHPDDEDGGMLAMESRGLGATALELTLTRGEGGQNKTGQELFDELGILRTLELLQADQFYGVEERFSRAVDFGFSKNAQETFDKWGGHDIPLADMVRVIRTFRPDVIVSVFSGTSNDGHGNHQASGMLTREAFRAAADPNRFPDQLKDGLSPWQPKKLYVGRFVGGENCQVTLNAGAYNPLLGTSYAELGTEGRGHQISQVSSPLVLPGNRSRCYNLVDSAFPGGTKPAATESGLFDGIDTSLPGIAARLGGEENKVPFLAAVLDKLDAAAKNAAGFGPRDMSMAAPILLGGVKILREIIPQVRQSSLSAAAKGELLTHLDTKLAQFEKAAADASALDLIAAVDPASNGQQGGFFRMEQTFLVAVPGQTFTMTAQLFNRGQQPIENVKLDLETPPGWKVEALDAPATKPIAYNTSATARFRVTVPPDAQYTRPYFYRDDPQTESVYRVLPQLSQFVTLPFPPPPVIAHAQYSIGDAAGEVRSVPQVRYIDPIYGQAERPLSVGPPMSVELQPETRIYSIEKDGSTQVRVGVRNNVVGGAQGGLRVQAPQGWRVQPESQPVKFTQNGEYASFEFTVTPPAGRAGAASALREQKYTITAVLDFNGKQYSDGYNVVARRDIGTFYYYRPARQVMSAVDVKLPPRLRVGYIMGAGDDIPPALQQLGMDVHLLSPEELAGGDLSRYATIVLGIRAYDVRTDVREENRRLLDFVQRGGTLLVQYNQGTGLFNAGHYTPYPATVSGERITVEEAPVEVLAPADPVFNAPNKITAKDFDGWVQERGLYFMSNWAPEYRALLSSHDPGEQPLKGGLLVATYGKGTYIFTGYAFFRQVPAGVPGAIRLFVNLLSVGANARP